MSTFGRRMPLSPMLGDCELRSAGRAYDEGAGELYEEDGREEPEEPMETVQYGQDTLLDR